MIIVLANKLTEPGLCAVVILAVDQTFVMAVLGAPSCTSLVYGVSNGLGPTKNLRSRGIHVDEYIVLHARRGHIMLTGSERTGMEWTFAQATWILVARAASNENGGCGRAHRKAGYSGEIALLRNVFTCLSDSF